MPTALLERPAAQFSPAAAEWSAMLERGFATGLIDEDASHRFSRSGEEMGAGGEGRSRELGVGSRN